MATGAIRNIKFVGDSTWLSLFPLLSAIGAVVLLTKIPQGTEVLRSITDLHLQKGAWLPDGWGRFLGFFMGYAAWGVANWYSSRVLLARDFSAERGTDDSDSQDTPFIRWWRVTFPRTFPLVAMGALAWFLCIDPKYFWVGVFSGIATVMVAAFVVLRRRVSGKLLKITTRSADRKYPELTPGDRVALWLMLALSLVLLLALAEANYWVARFLGAPAILFLALAAISLAGSILFIYLPKAHGWPGMIWLPIVFYFAFAQFGCSHNHRISDRTGLDQAPGVDLRPQAARHFAKWLAADRDRERGPLFLIAAEGGASRSGWWAAHVLGAADYATDGEFSRRVFAVSGISGGSVGASAYVALLSRRNDRGLWLGRQIAPVFPSNETCEALVSAKKELPLSVQSECFIGRDVLSTTVGYMLFPDLVQRFLPWKMKSWDRSHGLEDAWQKDWYALFRERTFEQPLSSLYPVTGSNAEDSSIRTDIPILLLNSASAVAGQPVVQAPVKFKSAEILDLFTSWPAAQALPLAALVHNSARFPVVSPGGEIYRTDEHGQKTYWDALVDGGYFENSGAFALRELMAAIVDELSSSDAARHALLQRVHVISIENQVPPRPGKQSQCTKEQPAGQATAKPIEQEELLTPLIGLYQSRSSRADASRRGLQSFLGQAPDGMIRVRLGGAAVARQQPSMNWYLTPTSRGVMWDSLAIDGEAKAALCKMFELLDEQKAPERCARLVHFRYEKPESEIQSKCP